MIQDKDSTIRNMKKACFFATFVLLLLFTLTPIGAQTDDRNDVNRIVIVDLEPKGGLLRENIIRDQAEIVASILEKAMTRIAYDKYDEENILHGKADVELDGQVEIEGTIADNGGEEAPQSPIRITEDNAEVIVEGNATVKIRGNTKVRFDNRLREDIKKLLESTQNALDIDKAAEISNILRAAVIKTQAFHVVERQKLKAILDEQKMQMSGLTAGSDDLMKIGELLSAQQVLLGTVGRLYGKIIITTRLVDVESGEVLFANTIYSDEEDLVYYLEELAREIAEKGIAERRVISLEEIRQFVKKREYRTAWQYLNAYLQKKKANEETQKLTDVLLANLSDQNFREARKALRRKKYTLARDLINEAIALRTEERFFQLRTRIEVEEEKYRERQKEIEQRQRRLEEERQKRREAMEAVDFATRVRQYYEGITVNGFLFGASYHPVVTTDLRFHFPVTSWGGELLLKNELFNDPNRGNSSFNWMGYIGINGSYIDNEGEPTIMLRPYVTPFLSWGLKLANLVITLGFDGGGVLWFGNSLPNGRLVGVSGGSLAMVEIKIHKRFGIFAGAKLEYLYFPENVAHSQPALRFVGGLSF